VAQVLATKSLNKHISSNKLFVDTLDYLANLLRSRLWSLLL